MLRPMKKWVKASELILIVDEANDERKNRHSVSLAHELVVALGHIAGVLEVGALVPPLRITIHP